MSLLQKLADAVPTGQDSPTLIDTAGNRVSLAGMAQKVQAIARGLVAAGMRRGDRVLFAVRPDANGILLIIAICEAGGVPIPVDPTTGPALFRSRMELLAPRWVVAESVLCMALANRRVAQLLRRRGVQLPPVTRVGAEKLVYVGHALPGTGAGISLKALQRLGAADDSKFAAPGPGAEAFIVFTSGTTGAPRAVVHSWRSMQGVFEAVGGLLGSVAGSVVYARDLHVILPALMAGATVVVPARPGFVENRVIRDLRKFRVTHYFCVAAELQKLAALVDAQKRQLPDTLREVWIGAAPVRAAFLKQLQGILARNTQVWCVYGMTEILPVARVSLLEKLAYQGEGDLVGACVPGVSARISSEGELLVRGCNLFDRYFGEPACDEHATGDLARLDGGRIVLLGRRKDMIIRRRFNIYPELYEPTIECIQGVRRCAMVGFYDDVLADERLVLVVEPDADIDVVKLKKRVWSELQAGPLAIDIPALPDSIVVMHLPVSGRSSKVDKKKLREQLGQPTFCA